jgi:hypothetical protein
LRHAFYQIPRVAIERHGAAHLERPQTHDGGYQFHSVVRRQAKSTGQFLPVISME